MRTTTAAPREKKGMHIGAEHEQHLKKKKKHPRSGNKLGLDAGVPVPIGRSC